MVLVPLAGRALPLAFRIAGRVIPVAAGGSGPTGFGLQWKGLIMKGLAAWGGMEAVEALLAMFDGDNSEAAKAAAIIEAIEDALDSGAIWLPEPPRGYEVNTYMGKLNWFHADLRTGNMSLTDTRNYQSRRN